jgi:hypothetical protein
MHSGKSREEGSASVHLSEPHHSTNHVREERIIRAERREIEAARTRLPDGQGIQSRSPRAHESLAGSAPDRMMEAGTGPLTVPHVRVAIK